ncbi:MAG: hypothetical protein LH479_11490 [Polaromonas sp.]|nr:hypothetical protein [Polaromonas sp.]
MHPSHLKVINVQKIALLFSSLLLAPAVFAAEHQIKMLNSGKDGITVF